jgi:hypothetical protein
LAFALITILTGNVVLSAIVIVFERTVLLPVIHNEFEVTWQVIRSPSSGLQKKEELSVPAFVPLIIHWYTGADPPFVIAEVKFTVSPGQKGLVNVVIEIPAGIKGLTTIVTGAEVAGLPLIQVEFDVILQITRSPFNGM